jgi:hypothetical protein
MKIAKSDLEFAQSTIKDYTDNWVTKMFVK